MFKNSFVDEALRLNNELTTISHRLEEASRAFVIHPSTENMVALREARDATIRHATKMRELLATNPRLIQSKTVEKTTPGGSQIITINLTPEAQRLLTVQTSKTAK